MPSTSAADGPDTGTLRAHLEAIAARGETATYQRVAADLGLRPPQTIHRLTVALERLMDEDAAGGGRALLAAVVVSRTGSGMPAPGFFDHARRLGLYDGPDRGPEAAAWHRDQLRRVRAALSP